MYIEIVPNRNSRPAILLREGAQVLYDVTSSYYEGHTCALMQFGHDRDGKRGKPIVVYGVLTDVEGRPIALEVYPGNTGDPNTVPAHVDMALQHPSIG
jgi:transposase